MTRYVSAGGLRVAEPLHALVRDEITPGTGIAPDTVWALLAAVEASFGERNRVLLERRDRLQAQIDAWFVARRGRALDGRAYGTFLEEIGYLAPAQDPFRVTTAGVDTEIADLAGPQLVVPVDNARYALNAANARWGSLYDALYGCNVISEDGGAERGRGYNPVRGERVIARANAFLDESVPLAGARWADVRGFAAEAGRLILRLADGRATGLATPERFAGFGRRDERLGNVLLRNHGLHIDIAIDPEHPIGRQHAAGVRDVLLESAVSTIMDCEDSVAAVDAEDKARVYRNWCGIMQGTLTASFDKGGTRVDRRLAPDREYQAPDGKRLTLPGRSLLLVRHVGAHVMTDAVTRPDGAPLAETLLDCVVTTLAALHDLGSGGGRNSRTGSVYVVKPKQHGPEEVRLSVELFAAVERGLGLPENTLKIGIMDEERRTTVNLRHCIAAARERVIFINTGFLDRTGDEIHTHMEAGPMIPKPEIKHAPWMLAYEDWNVQAGLDAGLPGHGQIGKGMWAVPDDMRAMLETKDNHPRAGASCAWVPSPTAATLHAVHYHQVDVGERQRALAAERVDAERLLTDILTPPLLGERTLRRAEIQRELDNNAQSILGYVVRWVEQGIGCSKVPDINDVGLMEDRATLRISSQHIANWLHHGIVDRDQVMTTLRRMAEVVDRQNAGDARYRPMAPDFEQSVAFQAAGDLILNGRREPNGYTEHVLMRRRRELKARQGA